MADSSSSFRVFVISLLILILGKALPDSRDYYSFLDSLLLLF